MGNCSTYCSGQQSQTEIVTMDIEKPDNLVWMFGIGANMNVAKLEVQKGAKVVDHCPAKVFDWEM